MKILVKFIYLSLLILTTALANPKNKEDCNQKPDHKNYNFVNVTFNKNKIVYEKKNFTYVFVNFDKEGNAIKSTEKFVNTTKKRQKKHTNKIIDLTKDSKTPKNKKLSTKEINKKFVRYIEKSIKK